MGFSQWKFDRKEKLHNVPDFLSRCVAENGEEVVTIKEREYMTQNTFI